MVRVGTSCKIFTKTVRIKAVPQLREALGSNTVALEYTAFQVITTECYIIQHLIVYYSKDHKSDLWENQEYFSKPPKTQNSQGPAQEGKVENFQTQIHHPHLPN